MTDEDITEMLERVTVDPSYSESIRDPKNPEGLDWHTALSSWVFVEENKRNPLWRAGFDLLFSLIGSTEQYPPHFSISPERYTFEPASMASGGFADVHVGVLDAGRSRERAVAVKVFRPLSSLLATENFMMALRKEILTWAALQHPNVVGFVGFRTMTGTKDNGTLGEVGAHILSELISGTTLREYIRGCSLNPLHTPGQPTSSFDPDTEQISLITDVGKALAHMHTLQIVHGDISDGNILVHLDGRAVLCDLGLAVAGEYTVGRMVTTRTVKGTPSWMSPERLDVESEDQIKRRDKQMDVWALGCVSYMVLTGKPPYYDKQAAEVPRLLTSGHFPNVLPMESRLGTHALNTDYNRLLEWCWQQDPAGRPHISQFLAFFQLEDGPSRLPSGAICAAIARTSRQTSAPMIGFEKDEIVHVYGAQGDQLRVRSKPGQVGYANRKDLDHFSLAEITANVSLVSPADGMLSFQKGDVLEVLAAGDIGEHWVALTAKGDVGGVNVANFTCTWRIPEESKFQKVAVMVPYEPSVESAPYHTYLDIIESVTVHDRHCDWVLSRTRVANSDNHLWFEYKLVPRRHLKISSRN